MNTLKEPIGTRNTVVKCDGGAGPLGHPVIYLNLGKKGKVICPYCSKVYVKINDKNVEK